MVIGLGNPGEQYAQTRHNAGFMVLNEYQQEFFPDKRFSFSTKFSSELLQDREVTLAKPQTYMNDSGKAVQTLAKFYKLQDFHDLYVVHDDLDIALGSYKLQFGTGPKIHNGLLSLYRILGTEAFWHVRVGVDSRSGDRTLPGYVYVMQQLSSAEETVMNKVCADVAKVIHDQVQRPSY